MPKFLKSIDHNAQRAINIADGSAATDAVTLQQLQAMVRGLDWKASARVASTGDIVIASPGATINGVTMAANDRFLAKNQTAGAENGIYVWNAAATPATRASDADSSAEVTSGMAITVTEGTSLPDTVWVLTTNDPITLGTTALAFTQLGGGAAAYTGGAGLVLSGSDFAVGAGTGITVNADDVAINTSVVVRKFAANCVATTNPQTFAHGLGTADVDVLVKEGTAVVYPDVTVDATNITVDWGSAPTASQYRVIGQG